MQTSSIDKDQRPCCGRARRCWHDDFSESTTATKRRLSNDTEQSSLSSVSSSSSSRGGEPLIIDLTGDDDSDDEDNHKPAALRKRLGDVSNKTAAEPSKPSTKKSAPRKAANHDSDSEVEIVQVVQRFQPVHAAAQSSDDDSDVTVLGTKNYVNLPHMRQHCTVHPFDLADLHKNYLFCEQCYCYICDIRAAECAEWRHHCRGHDKGPKAALWIQQRQKARAQSKKDK